jgi:trans-2,3-dihydro-3-hydroxyanthranilate isomerase
MFLYVFAGGGSVDARTAQVFPAEIDWQGESELHPYYVVDVFTSTPLQGNQLGVFVAGSAFDPDVMQRLARELNFAETVFLLPPEAGGDLRMRIFTPGAELPFAGHPVLGTAFLAGEALGLDEVRLETGAGVISIALERECGRVVFGWMEQPIPSGEPYPDAPRLLEALGVEASLLPVETYRNGPPHVYVRLASEDAVAALRPDLGELEALGVPANCFAGAGARWKTRMFYPAAGIPEDPATGSAAGPLAVHLVRHGVISHGEEITISQGEEIGRPSVLHARAAGHGDAFSSVEVGGAAVVVAAGSYRVSTS